MWASSARSVELGRHLGPKEPAQEVVRSERRHPKSRLRRRAPDMRQHHTPKAIRHISHGHIHTPHHTRSSYPNTTRQTSHAKQDKTRKKNQKKSPNNLPRRVDQRMVEADIRLALDDVHARAVQPALAEGPRERVRVDEGAARGVDEDGGGLHLPEEGLVDDVVRRGPAGGEDEEDVGLACERLERHALDLFDAEFRGEGGVRAGVGVGGGGGGGPAGVEGALEAEGDEAGEGGLGDAAEADEACGAHGRGGGCAQLGAAPAEGGPDVLRPLER